MVLSSCHPIRQSHARCTSGLSGCCSAQPAEYRSEMPCASSVNTGLGLTACGSDDHLCDGVSDNLHHLIFLTVQPNQLCSTSRPALAVLWPVSSLCDAFQRFFFATTLCAAPPRAFFVSTSVHKCKAIYKAGACRPPRISATVLCLLSSVCELAMAGRAHTKSVRPQQQPHPAAPLSTSRWFPRSCVRIPS